MKVSCICATYNRSPQHQWLLEEAVESFLRQDYSEKELIILNDCPGQELVCDAPGVVVINIPRRFHSHGEKLNAGIALAAYAVCVFPANIKHAFEGITVAGLPSSWWYHAPRLAAQPVLVWWALWCSGAVRWPWGR